MDTLWSSAIAQAIIIIDPFYHCIQAMQDILPHRSDTSILPCSSAPFDSPVLSQVQCSDHLRHCVFFYLFRRPVEFSNNLSLLGHLKGVNISGWINGTKWAKNRKARKDTFKTKWQSRQHMMKCILKRHLVFFHHQCLQLNFARAKWCRDRGGGGELRSIPTGPFLLWWVRDNPGCQ